MNLIDQISIGCAVNSAIINDVINTNDFMESCINVPLKYNILPEKQGQPWPFLNTSWEAYKLYCMLVVPKELYNLSDDDDFYKKALKKNIMRNFTVKKERKTFEESPMYHFNSLRNSVSHINYKFSKDGDFIMWDHPHNKNEQKDWHWHIQISQNNINKFLDELRELIFMIYNEIKNGIRDKDTYKKSPNKTPEGMN